ncbi:hypothetical protein ACU81Q_10520 [Komagataeibacter melomenusus]
MKIKNKKLYYIFYIISIILLFRFTRIDDIHKSMAAFYYVHQDIWLLLAAMGIVGLANRFSALRPLPLKLTFLPRYIWAVAAGLCAFCLVGHWLVLCGYDASRDEQMANFDSYIFASGHLVAPLSELWRDNSDILNTNFLYPSVHRGAWVSAYLPINAAIRALFRLFAFPELANPLITALGAIALWACVRQLWPKDKEAPWVALLLYCLSGQILCLGMTAYAMPAHLTFDLIWLWLYLQKRWWSDTLALVVAFFTVGLHQPIMHPLFAAPFLCLLVFQRQWPRVAFYFIGYAVIGLFWLKWPAYISTLVQSGGVAPPPGADYISQLVETVSRNGLMAIPYMLLNMARLIAWNHLLLLPLVWIGVSLCWRQRLVQALAGGIILTFMVMMIIMPYQGHAFGYRYFNGLLGNFILLAVYGWKMIVPQEPKWRSLMVYTSAGIAIVMIPMQLFFSHHFYSTFSQESKRIASMDADYFIYTGAIDLPLFGWDVVLNRPDLSNRPVRLIGDLMSDNFVKALCSTHPSVMMLPIEALRPIEGLFSQRRAQLMQPNNVHFANILYEAGCQVK